MVYPSFGSPSKQGFDVSNDENHIVIVTDNTLELQLLHLDGDGNPTVAFKNANFKGSEYLNIVTISQDSSQVYFTGTNSSGEGILWRWVFYTPYTILKWYGQTTAYPFYSILEIENSNLLLSTQLTLIPRADIRRIKFSGTQFSDIWRKQLKVTSHTFSTSVTYPIDQVYYDSDNQQSYHLISSENPLF